MNKSEFISSLKQLNTVTSVTGKKYYIRHVDNNSVEFVREHKTQTESISIDELYELYTNEPVINTSIAKSYISGRVQSPSVAILNHLKTGNPTKAVNIKTPRNDFKSINKDENLTFIKFDPEIDSEYNIPDTSGNYIICLKTGSKLPKLDIDFQTSKFKNLEVIYTGIAGKSLRRRDYKQHFTGNNAGSSTLRKSLGSLFGYKKIPRDRDPNNGRTKFQINDEIKLSNWMKSNLILYYAVSSNPDQHEQDLINKYNPPLNLSKNHNEINGVFRRNLSLLRRVR